MPVISSDVIKRREGGLALFERDVASLLPMLAAASSASVPALAEAP